MKEHSSSLIHTNSLIYWMIGADQRALFRIGIPIDKLAFLSRVAIPRI